MLIQATDQTVALILDVVEAQALLAALPVVLDNEHVAKIERALWEFTNGPEDNPV